MLGSSPELPATPIARRPQSVASSSVSRPRAVRPLQASVEEDIEEEEGDEAAASGAGVAYVPKERTARGWKFSARMDVPEKLVLKAAPRPCCYKCSVTYSTTGVGNDSIY